MSTPRRAWSRINAVWSHHMALLATASAAEARSGGSAVATGQGLVPVGDPERRAPARAGQTWVSTRFHPHLLAAAAGASGLALSGRGDYYPIKHRSLIEAGSRWRLADSSDLPSTPVRAGGFDAQAVEQLCRQKAALAAQIYPSAPSSIRRAVDALRVMRRG
jgi:hypothetical protein